MSRLSMSNRDTSLSCIFIFFLTHDIFSASVYDYNDRVIQSAVASVMLWVIAIIQNTLISHILKLCEFSCVISSHDRSSNGFIYYYRFKHITLQFTQDSAIASNTTEFADLIIGVDCVNIVGKSAFSASFSFLKLQNISVIKTVMVI